MEGILKNCCSNTCIFCVFEMFILTGMHTCFELYMRTCSVFQNIWSYVPKRFSSFPCMHANGAVPSKTHKSVLDGTAQFI